jgi:thiol-disulfide isomerase/thioredoxin
MEEYKAGGAKRAELIGELAKAHPDDARLPKLMPERWVGLFLNDKVDVAATEIDAALAKADKTDQKVSLNFLKAQLLSQADKPQPQAALRAAEECIKLAPKDQRIPMLLASMADSDDQKVRDRVAEIVLKDYAEGFAAESVKAAKKQRGAIGKPFDLEFTDAIKGETVSIKGLKGKVVVLDFWATWCGPCVAEMPTMKKLYAEYKGKGVEFIGVSLDQAKDKGGLDKLKKFVADEEIGWPQYYQGNYWQSEFSKGWGINSIPCVFIVDADGNLYSTKARGKLETLIPELLAKRDKTSAGGGQ